MTNGQSNEKIWMEQMIKGENRNKVIKKQTEIMTNEQQNYQCVRDKRKFQIEEKYIIHYFRMEFGDTKQINASDERKKYEWKRISNGQSNSEKKITEKMGKR